MLLGRNVYPFGLGLNFGYWWYLVVLLLILWRSKRKSWKRLCRVALSLLLLEGIWTWGWKQGSHKLDSFETLNVVTANVYFKNLHSTAEIDGILKHSPDILCLQEYGHRHQEVLTVRNAFAHRYRLPKPSPYGCAIYSKFPITHTEVIGGSKTVFLICHLDVDGKEVILINAHLTSPAIAIEQSENMVPLLWKNYRKRKAQLEQLKEHLAPHNGKRMILAGDLNTMPSESLFRQLQEDWVDVHNATSWELGYSFPHSFTTSLPPITRLDYVLLQGDLMPIETEVIESIGSDHNFLLAKVGI